MVRVSLALTLVFAGLSLSHPTQSKSHDSSIVARQADSPNVGAGNGQQFITGECVSAADCASGCCVGQAGGTGECKARVVTEQAGGSCDFGGAQGGNGTADNGIGNGPTENAGAGGACGAISDASGSENVGLGAGTQFITGQCFSAADCASGCCAGQGDGTARCGAQVPTEKERNQTCDFTCVA